MTANERRRASASAAPVALAAGLVCVLGLGALTAACRGAAGPPLVYTAAPAPVPVLTAAAATARPTGPGLEPKSPFVEVPATAPLKLPEVVVEVGLPSSLPAPDPAAAGRAEADDLIVKALGELSSGRSTGGRASLLAAFGADPRLGSLEHPILVGSIDDEYVIVNAIACGKSRTGHYDVRLQALTKTDDGRWADRLTLGCKYDPDDERVLFFDVSAFFGRF